MPTLNQEQISALIQFIEQAEDPGVITNVIVAAVLNWLYSKANDLPNKTDKDPITGALTYSQSPAIVLKSMGETLDGKQLSVAPIGIIYNETTKHIQKKTSVNGVVATEDLGSPVGSLVYCNSITDKLYRWTGVSWSQVGGNSGSDAQTQTNVGIIKAKFDALIDALANYAFINGKNDSMKIGELTWNDDSQDDPTPTPMLTSPEVNTTVDLGTNTGSGTSKFILIKGSNLTQDLSLSVAGNGFRVSAESVTASGANIGTQITVTYDGTSTTTAYGTLTISSSEVSVTVNLTAAYSVVATPALISPDANTTHIDVGNISADGDAVSKQILVQGENLTESLSLAITGGIGSFSVSPLSITKQEASTGATVTITYANATPQSTQLAATGELTISGGGITPRVIGLGATKDAESVTPTPSSGYVTEGLVLHLDGKDLTSGATSWSDTAGQRTFNFQGGAAVHLDGNNRPDGVKFSDYGDYAICSESLDQAYDSGTIEICFTPLSGFVDTTEAAVVDNLKRMYHMRLFFMMDTDDRICAMLNTKSSGRAFYFRSYGSTNISSPISKRNLSSIPTTASTISQNYDRGMINGVLDSTTPQGAKIGRVKSGTGMAIGGMVSDWYVGQQGETVPRVYLAMAIIHEVRIYSKKLTQSEMLQNQKEDNSRYNLGISALND